MAAVFHRAAGLQPPGPPEQLDGENPWRLFLTWAKHPISKLHARYAVQQNIAKSVHLAPDAVAINRSHVNFEPSPGTGEAAWGAWLATTIPKSEWHL
ncbi:hypothetical protein VP1G_10900 [Cytospora mali]|uniref:Uncharacterized protein n=1 Tax=Cytospora mali TaxID=578113 RepID=A0A194V0M1_CYTMA|nr:hypothetical protein VP1G_10900 [Valsa mali var. pyri (nom. inval.)]